MSKAERKENPLVPNKRLREMYVAMISARMLDEHLVAREPAGTKRRELRSTRGEEACRVSTAIDLQPGDLISDSQHDVVMDLLAGVKVERLLRRFSEKNKRGRLFEPETARQLPWIKEEAERLRLAMGVALLLRMRKQANVLLVFAEGETGKREWRSLLVIASRLELPILFVLLPIRAAQRNKGRRKRLALGTSLSGVPVIAVDAGDAVALYRVAQEAFGRLRGGGGPVVVDCVAFPDKGVRRSSVVDAVLQMRDVLLTKNIATKHWLDAVEDRFRRRIEAARVTGSVRARRAEKEQ